MKVHEAIVQVFEREGVEDIFALMSEEIITMLSNIEENWADDIQLIQARHEQGAAAMADGYARANGDIGVCIVGRGPAIAQTGTSLITARNGGSNLLYIVPEMDRTSTYDDKEFRQQTYLETMVGETRSVRSTDTLIPHLRDAFRELRANNGPVAVQISWDVIDAELNDDDELDYEPATVPNRHGTSLQPSDDAIDQAIDLYLDSDATKPPIVLAGRGAVKADARESIETLAERVNGYLATTLQAQGFFSGHPYSLGFIGDIGRPFANEQVTESDYVLAFGCSLNPHTVDSGHLLRDEAKIIQVDTDPSQFNQYTTVDLSILGDAGLSAQALNEGLKEIQIAREGEFWTEKNKQRISESSPLTDREFPAQPGTIDPRDVVKRLDEILPDERLVVHDAGHFATWVRDGITISHPNNHIWTLDVAAIGQGLPIGIGSAVATQNRTCVTFCGDAGFMMSIQEVETAARYDIPMIIIVMNDETLGAEYHVEASTGDPPEAAIINSPDLGAVAETLGAEGYTVRSTDDLDALEDQLGRRPTKPIVVDCRTNRNVRNRLYG